MEYPTTAIAPHFCLENGQIKFRGPRGPTSYVVEQKGAMPFGIMFQPSNNDTYLLDLSPFNIILSFKSHGVCDGDSEVFWDIGTSSGMFGVSTPHLFFATDIALYVYENGQFCLYLGFNGNAVFYAQGHQMNEADITVFDSHFNQLFVLQQCSIASSNDDTVEDDDQDDWDDWYHWNLACGTVPTYLSFEESLRDCFKETESENWVYAPVIDYDDYNDDYYEDCNDYYGYEENDEEHDDNTPYSPCPINGMSIEEYRDVWSELFD